MRNGDQSGAIKIIITLLLAISDSMPIISQESPIYKVGIISSTLKMMTLKYDEVK